MKKITALFAVLALAVVTALVSASPAGAQSAARIHLIHGIPGVVVNVVVDGSPVIEDFAFGETQDLSSFAGQTLVGLQVTVAADDSVAIDAGDFAVPATGNYTVIAHLNAAGAPTLGVFANDTSTIAAGEGRLVVRHTAEAPAVDILANGSVAFANVVNGAEGSADLAAGTITATVEPVGSDTVVIGPADLPIVEGSSLIVYAVGSVNSELSVLTETITGLGTAPAAVNTGTSPVSDGSGSTVTIALVAAALAGALVIGAGSLRLATVKR